MNILKTNFEKHILLIILWKDMFIVRFWWFPKQVQNETPNIQHLPCRVGYYLTNKVLQSWQLCANILHLIIVSFPICDKTVSRYCEMSPRGTLSLVENHCCSLTRLLLPTNLLSSQEITLINSLSVLIEVLHVNTLFYMKTHSSHDCFCTLNIWEIVINLIFLTSIWIAYSFYCKS